MATVENPLETDLEVESEVESDVEPMTSWPDHTQLPESDGTFVKNFQEHPQSILLSDSLGPVLERLHPEGNFAIGQDSGIYWRLADPPERGAVAPDWFYVPGVPATLDGLSRRSYVLWKEFLAPLIVLEFVSGTGAEERDRTPMSGKFWVYENVIRPGYYGIYEVEKPGSSFIATSSTSSNGSRPTSTGVTRSSAWAWNWGSGRGRTRTSNSPGCVGGTRTGYSSPPPRTRGGRGGSGQS